SSVSAQRGGGILGGPHYSAAKAGVLGLARAMAREFGPDGIRVNCVTPGLISTDINKDILRAEKKAEIAQTIPLGRLGGPDDVGGVCVFL
ncbi:SDR family oxidoreductase, partial [Acinetobacter baumannii]